MQTLQRTLFEDPFAVYLVLAVAAVVVAGAWYTRRRLRHLLALALLAALAAGTWALERAVVTDREEMASHLAAMADAIARNDMETLGTYLDEDFRIFDAAVGRGLTRRAALLAAAGTLATFNVREVRLLGEPIDEIEKLGPDTASGPVRVLVLYGDADRPARFARAWRLDWVRRPEGWRIRRAEPTDRIVP